MNRKDDAYLPRVGLWEEEEEWEWSGAAVKEEDAAVEGVADATRDGTVGVELLLGAAPEPPALVNSFDFAGVDEDDVVVAGAVGDVIIAVEVDVVVSLSFPSFFRRAISLYSLSL